MEKVDFRKTLKHLYQPSAKEFSRVTVPRMRFVKVDGKGDPNVSKDYASAVQWLYGLSYALKFASKNQLGKDYAVAPLEGLWWADDMDDFLTGNKAGWSWTVMIMQPDWITDEMFSAAVEKSRAKLGEPPQSLRLEDFEEGDSVQIMYFGPYSGEGPTIARLHHEYLPAKG